MVVGSAITRPPGRRGDAHKKENRAEDGRSQDASMVTSWGIFIFVPHRGCLAGTFERGLGLMSVAPVAEQNPGETWIQEPQWIH